jgi:lipid A ethanolaminephosphotransferase
MPWAQTWIFCALSKRIMNLGPLFKKINERGKKIFPKILIYTFLSILCLAVLEIFDSCKLVNGFKQCYKHTNIRAYLYLLVYICSIFSILILLDINARWKKMCIWFVFFILLFIDYTYRTIEGSSFGFSEINIALQEIGFASDALSTYMSSIFIGLIKSLCICILLYFIVFYVKKIGIVKANRLRYSFIHLSFVFMMFPLVGFITYKTECRFSDFPLLYRVPATVYYCLNNQVYIGERDSLINISKHDRLTSNILYIVDESVRSSAISLNNTRNSKLTPYLGSIKNGLIDFGECCSAANNSASTNLILRTGLKISEIPDEKGHLYRNTNIFQYAKNAGYRTVYIDAQCKNGDFNNGMREIDLNYIDKFIQLNENNLTDRDSLLIDSITSVYANSSNCFIYFNKSGSHFPYEKRYPIKKRVFKPVMQAGESLSSASKESALNSYRNAVRWTVDDFFRHLLPKLDMHKTSIVYTSDHGQNIKDFKKTKTHSTHKKPPKIQASVPLLLMGEICPKLDCSFDSNTSSHYQLFASLLIMMGYDDIEVKNKYSIPIWEKYSEKRKFVSGSVIFKTDTNINDFDL